MSIDTISVTDEIVLNHVRNPDAATVLGGVRPSDPLVAEIRHEIESHTTGTEVRTQYGLFAEGGTFVKGTLLTTRPSEEAFQDRAYDSFLEVWQQRHPD